jgi:hypothetical protein
LLLLQLRKRANRQRVILVIDRGIPSAVSGGRGQRNGLPFVEQTRPEDATERLPELAAHDAVKEKVDGAVDESQDVRQFTEVTVTVGEESVSQDAAEKSQNALREFGDEEENQNGQQHASCPVMFLRSISRCWTSSGRVPLDGRNRVFLILADTSASQNVFLGRVCVVAFEILATFLGANQSAYQPETEKS